MRAKSLSRIWFFATSWNVVCQAPLSTGILQARILERVAMPSSQGSSQSRDGTCISCIGRQGSLPLAPPTGKGEPGLKRRLVVQSLSLVGFFATSCSTPCFPVLHYLPKFAQTHVHWVDDVIQPSHPLSSPSPPAFNPSQHLGLFQWVSSSHQVAKILELQLQHRSFQRTFSCFPLGWTGWISLLSKGLSRLFFITTVWKQFFSVQLSSWSNSPICTWLLEKP